MKAKINIEKMREYSIFCGHGICNEIETVHELNVKHAEKKFREIGWKVRDGSWICPFHVKEKQVK
jgi:hypothetical protein